MPTLTRSVNEVHDSLTQFRTPVGLLPVLAAFMIHFFSSWFPASGEPWDSEVPAGAEISCIVIRKSEACEYGMEKASELSEEMVANELEELGRRWLE